MSKGTEQKENKNIMKKERTTALMSLCKLRRNDLLAVGRKCQILYVPS
jgi:hypothetical protein|nr:MAG TPA: hypothetical protein [Bacteriophage sp.]